MALRRRGVGGDPRTTQSFEMHTPKATHHVPASCDEVNCSKYREGFVIVLDPLDSITAARAAALRSAGRGYGEFMVVGGIVAKLDIVGPYADEAFQYDAIKEHEGRVFIFPPGESCFKAHTRLRMDRDPIMVYQHGARFSVNGSGSTEHMRDTRTDRRRIDADELKGRMNEAAGALDDAKQQGSY